MDPTDGVVFVCIAEPFSNLAVYEFCIGIVADDQSILLGRVWKNQCKNN